MTYAPPYNSTMSILQFGDFLHLKWHNYTFFLDVALYPGGPSTFVVPYTSKYVYDWFFTFNYKLGVFQLIRDEIIYETATLDWDIM